MLSIATMSPFTRLGTLAIASTRRGNTLTLAKVAPSISVQPVLGGVYLVTGVK